MEALGIALGVLPLIVSVIEHYDFFAPFISHCAFIRELQNFRRTLDARKLLFRNECRLLLEAFVEEELIEEMFRDGSRHPSWKDKDLNGRLRTYLGEAYGPCTGMIMAVEECLDQMRHKTQGLGTVLQPKAEGESIGDKQWRQRVSSYLKLAFGKKGLDTNLNVLKELNEDLRELSRQTRELKDCHEKRSQLRANRQEVARRSDLSGFQTIQKTSENLYRALSRVSSCVTHKEHSAALCIDATPLLELQSPRVKFNMGFGASMGGPVWINIESTITGDSAEGTIQVVQDTRPLVACLKRKIDASDSKASMSNKTPKPLESRQLSRTTFASSQHICSPDAICPQYRASHKNLVHCMDVPDLSIQNFCFHIQQNPHAPNSADVCAGFLREGVCSHLLYLPPRTSCMKKEPQSLAHIISSISTEWPLSRYSRTERVRLAKVLAKAVLEYHDTPWLLESWRSQDVHFYTESSQPLAALDLPYLTARFPSQGKISMSGQDQSIAQNNTLFGLATIFLELDFGKPLSYMRLPGDVVENSTQDTEFKTAARLAKSTFPGLGPDFRKIIRKCLHCNFGIDNNNLVESEDLKTKIHEEVICELEDLERTLAGCTLVETMG